MNAALAVPKKTDIILGAFVITGLVSMALSEFRTGIMSVVQRTTLIAFAFCFVILSYEDYLEKTAKGQNNKIYKFLRVFGYCLILFLIWLNEVYPE